MYETFKIKKKYFWKNRENQNYFNNNEKSNIESN